jgi:hypothetical protein
MLILLEGPFLIQAATVFVLNTFSNFLYRFKINVCCSNGNRSAAIFFYCPPFNKAMLLAFL